jgi:hypothetical protein
MKNYNGKINNKSNLNLYIDNLSWNLARVIIRSLEIGNAQYSGFLYATFFVGC